MDGQPFLTSNAQHLRVVQQLLWDVISLHLYPAERDEIRRALGRSLLDENETLFAEAGALADILGDVQLNTAGLLVRHRLCSNPQRSLVESEIRLLIERLHSSAAVSPYGSSVVRDRDPDSLLPRSGRRDKALLDYVATVAQIAETGGRPPSSSLPPRPPSTGLSSSSRPGTSSRPPTAFSTSAPTSLHSPLSRPGTASPTLHGSRPSSAASSTGTRYTDAPSVVAGVADNLCLATIDTVRETLSTALMDERAALLEDIEYLQGLLEAEADLQVRAVAPPPSLAELKDYSSRLAAVVANEEARVEHEVRVSAMFTAAEQQHSKPGRLRSMVDVSRRPTSGSSSGTTPVAPAPSSPPSTSQSQSGSNVVQTLVVHGTGEEEAAQQGRQSRPRLSSSAALGQAGSVSDAACVASEDVSSEAPLSVLSRSARVLAAVRLPGSGGTCKATAAPPSILPAPVALRPAAPLPPSRISASPTAEPTFTAGKPIRPPSCPATTAAALADGNGSAAVSPPSSARILCGPSPGRLRPISTSAAGVSASKGSPNAPRLDASSPHPSPQSPAQFEPQSLPYKQSSLQVPPSPARAAGTDAATATGGAAGPAAATFVLTSPGPAAKGTCVSTGLSAAAAPMVGLGSSSAVAPVGLRPSLLQSSSVGRSTSSVTTAPSSGAAVSLLVGGSSRSSGITPRTVSNSRISSEAAAGGMGRIVAIASPGSAVAARLGSAAGSGTAGSDVSGRSNTIQPRALLGNKQSIVEKLDEEVDMVRGGVAAIMERYNIRPSTPTSGSPAVAPPPSTSRDAT